MTEIRPFRAWRYSQELLNDPSTLVAPLFDVVTDEQRRKLYALPWNSIHLSVPAAGQDPRQLLDGWKKNGILVRESLPALFPYSQHYTDPLTGAAKRRLGFICHIRTRSWDDRVILHHENTIPAAVNDRSALLMKTGFNSSPTHGLYQDNTRTLEPLLEEALAHPIQSMTDQLGVRHDMGIIHDHDRIQAFMDFMKEKSVILADGHHRFEASINYSAVNGTLHQPHSPARPEDMHLMCLTNTTGNDLTILPTHRLISAIPGFDAALFTEALTNDFEVVPESTEEIPMPHPDRPGSFGVITASGHFRITLKPGHAALNHWPFPDLIRELDLTMLHHFIIEKILGIPGARQRSAPELRFERDAAVCLQTVRTGEAQVALLTNPVPIGAILNVCASGSTLPQKSTYFFPKMVSGLVFSSVLAEENPLPDLSGFH